MSRYDDNHAPVPSVEFPYDEVGRALGDLDADADVMDRVVAAFVAIPPQILGMVGDGVARPTNLRERYHRNCRIARRVCAMVYLFCHDYHGMTVEQVATLEGYDHRLLGADVAWVRSKIGAHKMLRNLTGTRE